jgi:hypothetical protein
VGRSKATVEHYFGNNTEILLAKHCVSLRRAIRSHCGQWQIVRQHRLQGLLYLSGHQVMLCFGLPPAVQWGGRTGKWGNFRQHQKEHHRPAQEQMGRRTTEGDFVPQHHNVQNHAVFTVQVALWRGSHVTRRVVLGNLEGHPLQRRRPSGLRFRTLRRCACRQRQTCHPTRKKPEGGKTKGFNRSSYGRETWYYARYRREG